MLTHLVIDNFTIIEHIELEFGSGMIVFTGETGAGKSIILDALGIVLGDRADSQLIRPGSNQCDITVHFSCEHNQQAADWLQAHDLFHDDECILRRTFTVDGRSRNYINGTLVTLQNIRTLAAHLVHIHSQHEQQDLLKKENQRILLDKAGHLEPLGQTVYKHYQQWHVIAEECEQLKTQINERQARMEFLQYQLDEFDRLATSEGEYASLVAEHQRLAKADTLMLKTEEIYQALNDTEQGGLTQNLQRLSLELTKLSRMVPELTGASDCLENAKIMLSEATIECRYFLNQLEANPERLQQIDGRLQLLHEMGRKYKISPKQLPKKYLELLVESQNLSEKDEELATKRQQLSELKKTYDEFAKQLSSKREATQRQFATTLTEYLHQLNMPGGRFVIALTQEAETSEHPKPHGYDTVEFLIATNPGQPLQPLQKVISGGELSRLSLAAQVLTTQHHSHICMIFDEVDVGVGGKTAEIIGRLLLKLSQFSQLICITHLPQVASLGCEHFAVQKIHEERSTHTIVKKLTAEERIEEIARMLGGLKITEHTINHAKEMLSTESAE